MDQCTHEVRAKKWMNIILECQQRPTGMSAKQWLKETGITEQSYYKWQQKFRTEKYAQMLKESSQVPSVYKNDEVTFAELPYKQPEKDTDISVLYNDCKPSAVIKTGSVTIAISNDISSELLSCIIKEVSHA